MRLFVQNGLAALNISILYSRSSFHQPFKLPKDDMRWCEVFGGTSRVGSTPKIICTNCYYIKSAAAPCTIPASCMIDVVAVASC